MDTQPPPNPADGHTPPSPAPVAEGGHEATRPPRPRDSQADAAINRTRRGAYEAVAIVATGAIEARARKEAKQKQRATLRQAVLMLVACTLAVLFITVLTGAAGLIVSGGWKMFENLPLSAGLAGLLRDLYGLIAGR